MQKNLQCLLRAVRNRCPRCGEGRILKNLFTREEHCSHCGLKYSREDGFFSAAMPINYAIVCVLWIVPLIVLEMLGLLPEGWVLWLCLGGALLWPILCYRYSQCLWLGAYYYMMVKDIDSGKDIRESGDDS